MTTGVRAEQIRTLYRQSTWVFVANPVNAAIVALVLRAWSRRGPAFAWVAVMALVTAGRLLLRRAYGRRAPSADQAPRWGRRFVLGTFAVGATWGLGCALLFNPHDAVNQLVVTFALGGMIAGASGTLASYLPAFLAFETPALLLLAGRIVLEGDPAHLGFVALMAIYGVVMTMVAANAQRSLIEAFKLRFENDALLAQLKSTRGSLEDVNRTLEQRVAERGAAFERQSEALRDAQRMESVGMLAGGIAHDFNNLLTVVLANVSLLQSSHLSEQEMLSVEEIRSSANRGASLVSQLLAFSRRQVVKTQVLDLSKVVVETEQFLRRLMGTRIELHVSVPPQPVPVTADPSQIQQVIVNLATNARDAMPEGGRLTIESAAYDKTDGSDGPPIARGPYAVLTVRDTGIGMDADTRRLAFNPFFTTKEVGRGTGLGLATVYGIVEQSSGSIFIESEPGRGTSFSVYLPRAPVADLPGHAQAVGPAPSPAPLPPARRGTVLLAEDNQMVRDVTARLLRDAGHTVLLAADGDEALKRARDHSGNIDLLIADLVMARRGGIEVAKLLARERPDLRILFVSGFSWDQTLPSVDPERGVDFLQKPFAPDDMVRAVARLLAAPPRVSTPGLGSAAVRFVAGFPVGTLVPPRPAAERAAKSEGTKEAKGSPKAAPGKRGPE
jgi:signal transduction histidine kinase/CheY-like chemotaxis protein